MNFGQGISVEQAKAQFPNFERDARLNPKHPGCLANFASVLFTVGRVEESIPLFEEALELDRTSSGCSINLAMAYKELGRFEESTKALEYGFEGDSESFYAKLGYAESLLRAGHWQRAWPWYEEARITKFGLKNEMGVPHVLPEFTRRAVETVTHTGTSAPRLPNGQAQRVVVYGEGGIGDRVCYSRFLPILAELGFEYTYFPDSGIYNNPGFSCASLFKRLPWSHSQDVGGEIEAVAWTTQFALLSAFAVTPNTIPDFPSPLTAETQTLARYQELMRANLPTRPKLVLVWDAGEKFEGDRKFRSLRREQAARIAVSCPSYSWINGVINTELGEPFYNFRPWETWEDTAAIMAAADGVITVDTGPMHLAGAMGLPLWVILSGNSDWKFLKRTTKCYWYKQARLIRNKGMGFETAIDELIGELNKGIYPCQRSLSQ